MLLRPTLGCVLSRRIGGRRSTKIAVLNSVREPNLESNPFITLLAGSIGSQCVVSFFTWPRAILGRYDVMHLHWPEDLFRAKKSPVRAFKYILFLLLVGRVHVTRKPVLLTVHNEAPHEETTRIESILLRICMSMVTKRVYMSEAQRSMAGRSSADVVIPHGHYKDVYPELDSVSRDPENPSILYFGFVRRYKGIEQLVESFVSLVDAGFSTGQLTIAGKPKPLSYGVELQECYSTARDIEWRLGFQDDENLLSLFSKANLVVLPYRHMVNSGALFLALSLGRPVLAPKNQITQEIQHEVGSDWLYLYKGDLQASDLNAALNSSTSPTTEDFPNLSQRDWSIVGKKYAEAYESVLRCSAREFDA